MSLSADSEAPDLRPILPQTPAAAPDALVAPLWNGGCSMAEIATQLGCQLNSINASVHRLIRDGRTMRLTKGTRPRTANPVSAPQPDGYVDGAVVAGIPTMVRNGISLARVSALVQS